MKMTNEKINWLTSGLFSDSDSVAFFEYYYFIFYGNDNGDECHQHQNQHHTFHH